MLFLATMGGREEVHHARCSDSLYWVVGLFGLPDKAMKVVGVILALVVLLVGLSVFGIAM